MSTFSLIKPVNELQLVVQLSDTYRVTNIVTSGNLISAFHINQTRE